MSKNYGNDERNRTVVSPEELQVGKKYSSENPPISAFGDLHTISSDRRYDVGANLNWFVVIQNSQDSMSGWSWKPVFVARFTQLNVADARDIDSFESESFAEWVKHDPGAFFDYLSDSGGRDPEIEEISRVNGNQVQMVVYSSDLGRAEITLRK